MLSLHQKVHWTSQAWKNQSMVARIAIMLSDDLVAKYDALLAEYVLHFQQCSLLNAGIELVAPPNIGLQ